jgi:FlaA1/EpsC-like NDP-sugar epimerase
VVGSITNKELMESLFKAHKIDYLLHAAAYKHVPMMEDNPAVAIQNNVVGTRILADLAVKYNVGKFVMISTDKAVNPTNVMGCSKRICEIYCQSLNAAIVSGKIQGVTQFVTTRFGNVLGSNGSVIPHFREQIKNGGPITVTDPNIERFFMLIPEACKLVLEAGTMGKGGEIYVFDMGKPVKIVDLAKRMIKLSGARDVKIVFTGLRDGEKLYEEVLASAENTQPTDHPKIMIAKVREYDYETACQNEKRLLEASYSFDDMEVVRIMKEIVPEYKSNSSKYEVLDK